MRKRRAGRGTQKGTPIVYAAGKSDHCVIPKKAPNKGENPAEEPEGRRWIKENAMKEYTDLAQDRVSASRGLQGVREAAQRDKGVRFTTLLHHVNERLLLDSFYLL